MMLAMWTWTGALGALPLARNGWLPWMPEVATEAARLARHLQEADAGVLAGAVNDEARARIDTFMRGIDAYRRHPYRRDLQDPTPVATFGSARLRDYGTDGPGGRPVLFVPSLANRAYILDLSQETSLVRDLAARGVRPYLLDWGTPGPQERGFALADYIGGPLRRALETVAAAAGGPVPLVGHCMGGNLALAAAVLYPDLVSALALLATPWDFHAEGKPPPALFEAGGPADLALATLGEVPVDLIQAFFASRNPLRAARRFRRFAAMPEEGAERVRFIAAEDWLNDGVPLATPVARECLLGWYGRNRPHRGTWKIAGRRIDPARVGCPTFVVLAHGDRLVPTASAAALADALPGPKVHRPQAGSVGMVVGKGHREALWDPLYAWLTEVGTASG